MKRKIWIKWYYWLAPETWKVSDTSFSDKQGALWLEQLEEEARIAEKQKTQLRSAITTEEITIPPVPVDDEQLK